MSSRATDIESMVVNMSEEHVSVNQRQQLEFAINDLIAKDFDGLLQLLYRLDIDEAKLRVMLSDMPGTDAAAIITNMIIERQVEKIKSRKRYSKRDNNISDEERW